MYAVHVVPSRWERVDPQGWGGSASADLCRGTATRSFPTRRKRGYMHHSIHTESAMLLKESQKAELPLLEPALEALLRSADLDENLISLFRFRKILDRQLFVALDAGRSSHRRRLSNSTQKSLKTNSSLPRSPLPKCSRTPNGRWTLSRRRMVNQSSYSARTGLLCCDSSRRNLGSSTHPSSRAFEEKLASGELKAETLAQIINETEEEEQRKLKPEPSRHLGINLDASLMIQTRRRYLSAMPQNTELLRTKHRNMSNMWLLTQMR